MLDCGAVCFVVCLIMQCHYDLPVILFLLLPFLNIQHLCSLMVYM